jgi:hypothetical protein
LEEKQVETTLLPPQDRVWDQSRVTDRLDDGNKPGLPVSSSSPHDDLSVAPFYDIVTGNVAPQDKTEHVSNLKDNDNASERSTSPSSSSSSEHDMTRISTHNTTNTGLGRTITGVAMHTPHTNEKGHGQASHVFVVSYQGPNDEMNPHNWPVMRKVLYTILVALIGLIVGFASSVDSAAAPQAAEEFGVSEVVESLATTTYLVGFGFGAFTAGPLSETFGRNPIYLVTMTLFMAFTLGSALSPNIGAQLAFRFLAGYFGSTPLTCAGGSISDMWNATERTIAFPGFANAAFWGPILGVYQLRRPVQ